MGGTATPTYPRELHPGRGLALFLLPLSQADQAAPVLVEVACKICTAPIASPVTSGSVHLIPEFVGSTTPGIARLCGDHAFDLIAVACAIEIQQHVREHDTGGSEADPIQFRIGINVGDIIIEDDDIFGDGVNIAARIESVAAPGGVSLSEDAWRQVQGKVPAKFVDGGEQSLKNIAHPVRVYRVELGGEGTAPPAASSSQPVATVSSVPDKPSIAVLPFQNMSGDPEQDYFCDGLVEDIITTLSKLAGLRVIARNSSFVYKGRRSISVRRRSNLVCDTFWRAAFARAATASGSRRN